VAPEQQISRGGDGAKLNIHSIEQIQSEYKANIKNSQNAIKI
jgi:hypothetical protein